METPESPATNSCLGSRRPHEPGWRPRIPLSSMTPQLNRCRTPSTWQVRRMVGCWMVFLYVWSIIPSFMEGETPWNTYHYSIHCCDTWTNGISACCLFAWSKTLFRTDWLISVPALPLVRNPNKQFWHCIEKNPWLSINQISFVGSASII